MNARVLVVEDEREIAELVELYLRREQADVVLAASGEEALRRFRDEIFDLVLLDINLPGVDGFEVLSELRRSGDIPVIVVSAREADEDQILALGIGADEYVTKPFSPRVLVARARAILRRRSEAGSSGVRFGDYRFDPETYVLKRGEERVNLSAKEFDVLAALLRAEGRPMRSEELYAEVWGNQYGDVATIGVYIQRIRRKLERDPREPEFVETIHGKGYRFAVERLS